MRIAVFVEGLTNRRSAADPKPYCTSDSFEQCFQTKESLFLDL